MKKTSCSTAAVSTVSAVSAGSWCRGSGRKLREEVRVRGTRGGGGTPATRRPSVTRPPTCEIVISCGLLHLLTTLTTRSATEGLARGSVAASSASELGAAPSVVSGRAGGRGRVWAAAAVSTPP